MMDASKLCSGEALQAQKRLKLLHEIVVNSSQKRCVISMIGTHIGADTN